MEYPIPVHKTLQIDVKPKLVHAKELWMLSCFFLNFTFFSGLISIKSLKSSTSVPHRRNLVHRITFTYKEKLLVNTVSKQ